jgi:hypothetical protein
MTVEEFKNEFAKDHWRVEAKQFAPTPGTKLISENAAAAALRM